MNSKKSGTMLHSFRSLVKVSCNRKETNKQNEEIKAKKKKKRKKERKAGGHVSKSRDL